MIINSILTNDQVAIFKATDVNTSADRSDKFIVVSLDEVEPDQRYKKQVIAHFLNEMAITNRHTDWREIDRMVEKLNSSEFHII